MCVYQGRTRKFIAKQAVAALQPRRETHPKLAVSIAVVDIYPLLHLKFTSLTRSITC
jgi:hypothetical protein